MSLPYEYCFNDEFYILYDHKPYWRNNCLFLHLLHVPHAKLSDGQLQQWLLINQKINCWFFYLDTHPSYILLSDLINVISTWCLPRLEKVMHKLSIGQQHCSKNSLMVQIIVVLIILCHIWHLLHPWMYYRNSIPDSKMVSIHSNENSLSGV